MATRIAYIVQDRPNTTPEFVAFVTPKEAEELDKAHDGTKAIVYKTEVSFPDPPAVPAHPESVGS